MGDPPGHNWQAISILRHQLQDPFCRLIHNYLRIRLLEGPDAANKETTHSIAKYSIGCTLNTSGLACRFESSDSDSGLIDRLRVLLPETLEGECFKIYHDQCGHMGVNPTLRLIARRYVIRKLSKKLRVYILDCGPCAKTATGLRPSGGVSAPIRGTCPGQSYTADVYELGFSCDGYDHLFIIVDNFSKWLRAIPLKGPGDTETLLRLWKYEVTRNESLAAVIKSDRGSNLISKLYTAYCDMNRTQPLAGASGDHHSAAIAERLIKTLARVLRSHRISTKDQRWNEYIIDLEMLFNQHGLGVGESPFYYARLRDPLCCNVSTG